MADTVLTPDDLVIPTEADPWARPVQPGIQVGTHGYLDDYTALQWGLAKILGSLVIRTVDGRALVDQGQVKVGTMRFSRVYLDHPDDEDERVPTPSAVISESTPTTYDLAGAASGQQLLEDTVNVWAPGTVLVKLWEGQYTLAVTCWLANKDDRAAVRKALVEAFGVEPNDPRSGRRVFLPWYWDRPARYDLQRISYPDSDELALAGTWPLAAEVIAQVSVVQLVQAPGCLRTPQVGLSADPGCL